MHLTPLTPYSLSSPLRKVQLPRLLTTICNCPRPFAKYGCAQTRRIIIDGTGRAALVDAKKKSREPQSWNN